MIQLNRLELCKKPSILRESPGFISRAAAALHGPGLHRYRKPQRESVAPRSPAAAGLTSAFRLAVGEFGQCKMRKCCYQMQKIEILIFWTVF